jgi:hypothetical protein
LWTGQGLHTRPARTSSRCRISLEKRKEQSRKDIHVQERREIKKQKRKSGSEEEESELMMIRRKRREQRNIKSLV